MTARAIQACLALWLGAAPASAAATPRSPSAEPATAQPSWAQASFDTLKTLAGTWTGTVTTEPHQAGIEGPIQVTLRVGSAGSLLIHEITPGGMPEPTLIFLEDGRLTLVHYCEAGNRPRLVARAAPGSRAIDFEFATLSGSREPTYVQGCRFGFLDASHHTEDWTFALPEGKRLRAHYDLRRTKAARSSE